MAVADANLEKCWLETMAPGKEDYVASLIEPVLEDLRVQNDGRVRGWYLSFCSC